jgi:prepilin-type N-terminal cleavage/methylation domain-containing protein
MKMETKTKKGFTLLELMVVIAIMSIMSTLVIVSLAKSKNDRDVEAAGREVAAALREAQNDALTGKSGTNQYPCSVTFQVTGGGSGYRLLYNYNSSPGQSDCGAAFQWIYNKALSSGVSISPGSGNTVFSVPHGTFSSGTTGYTLNKGSSQYDVNVSGIGVITDGFK